MKNIKTLLNIGLLFGASALFTACPGGDDIEQSPNIPSNIDGPSKEGTNYNGHDYVDLGLSVYWATCNIGATTPSEQGTKYKFSELYKKNISYTEYSSVSIVELLWGGDWRLPLFSEIEELVDKCKWSDKIVNGVEVLVATGPNGKSIYFPYTSYVYNQGYIGVYWSGERNVQHPLKAYALAFNTTDIYATENDADYAALVRPVIHK